MAKSSKDPQWVRVRSDWGKGRISESDDVQPEGSQSPFSSLSHSFIPSIPRSFNKTYPERLLGTSFELRAGELNEPGRVPD